MKNVKWLCETALFFTVAFLVALLPYRMALRLGDALGLVAFHLVRSRRRVAVENIANSLDHLQRQEGWLQDHGSAEDIARQSFMNYGRNVMEACRIYVGRDAEIVRNVEFRGTEHLRSAQSRQKGVLGITGHCGNWEVMALAFGVKLSPCAVLARRLDNPYLNRALEKVRLKFDNSIIYKSGSVREILTRFRRKEIIGILIDQAVIPSEGCLVEFLGRPAWTTFMPALLARKSGVPVLPFFVHREGERHVVEILPEVNFSPEQGGEKGDQLYTAHLTSLVEAYVVRHPTEWYWVHKRWKRAPPHLSDSP
jgi:Kdo2-lipid IVA lauroyltransferase/acyltransferase